MSEAAAKKTAEPKKEQGQPGTPVAKPKKDLMSILVIVLVALNFASVLGMGVYIKKMWGKIFEMQTRIEEQAHKEQAVEDEPEKHEKNLGKEVAPPVQGTLYPMDSFLVNIASDQGPKFLQTQMEFELPDPALEDEITRKKAAIRDAVIVLLSSRTYKQLREAQGMGKLRNDILKAINNLLSTGKVKEIYFTQFHFN